MSTKDNPQKWLAVVRESECIGCTKCIDACPVDAILGSANQMHTVIASACIGCKLCVAPCPVDCIDLIAIPEQHTRIPAEHIKQRYQARQKRLQMQEDSKDTPANVSKKEYIMNAIARIRANNKTSMR